MDWAGTWNTVKNFFVTNVWNIVIFFAVLFVGIIAIKLAIRILRRLLMRTKIESLAQNFMLGLLKIAFYLVLVLILLRIIGVEITGIMTTLSALVLAVGLALESNISNIANGIVIASTKMFKKGDFISIAGVEGNVAGISFLFTTINTVDNKKIIIPNSTIVNSSLTNYGANTIRRVDFTFSVAYESDVELVKKTVVKVMESNGKVILDDKHTAFCRLKTLNSSSLDFFANCWCDGPDYWDVYYYVVENVYNEFKRERISVPYEQIEVRQRTDEVVLPIIGEGLPERVEKERPEQHQKFNIETDSFKQLVNNDKFNRYKKILKEAKKEGKLKCKKEQSEK